MQSLSQDEVGVFSVVFLPYLLSISISMSRHKNLPRPNKNDQSASYLSRYLSSTFISFVLFRLFISLLNYSILLLFRTCRHNNSFQSQKDNMKEKDTDGDCYGQNAKQKESFMLGKVWFARKHFVNSIMELCL